jgi:molecular chaperone DnaK (HSP70)
VPSRIAYAHENSKFELTQNAWGYEVDPTMISCSWTKLLLDQRAMNSLHDDPALQLAVDQGMLRTPNNYTAQQVCSDFLKEIHKYMTARLIKQLSKQVLDSTPVDCWLTVPAVWSDHARNATRAAAHKAGFGSRPQDTINIISEPEAGAIAALHRFMQPGSLNGLRVCSKTLAQFMEADCV